MSIGFQINFEPPFENFCFCPSSAPTKVVGVAYGTIAFVTFGCLSEGLFSDQGVALAKGAWHAGLLKR